MQRQRTVPGYALVLVLFSCLQGSVQSAETLATSNCGTAAAWSMLTALNVEVTPDAVQERVDTFSKTDEFTTLLELRRIINCFGVELESRRFRPSDLALLPSPAVLLLKDQNRADTTGHFVTLLRHDLNTVVIADWKRGVGIYVVRVPCDIIVRDWTGVALIANSDSTHPQTAWLVLMALVTVGIVSRTLWKHGIRPPSMDQTGPKFGGILVAATVCLSVLCGCSQTPQSTPKVFLRFENPSLQLGRQEVGQRLSCRFPFRVEYGGKVRIKSLTSSCGCTNVTNDIVGRELSAGQAAEIVLEYTVPGIPGAQSAFARLETEPASPFPIVIAIHCEPKLAPVSSVKTLQIEGRVFQPVSGKLVFTHRRGIREPALQLDRRQSQLSDFVFDKIESDSEKVITNTVTGEREIVDRTTIWLKSLNGYSFGEHQGILRIAWSDSSTTEIPWVVRIPYPFEFSSRHLFVGVVRPGSNWEKRLRLRQGSSVDRVAKFDVVGVDARMESIGMDEVILRGTAPQKSGRFAGEVVVQFEDSKITPFRVPLTGIVRESP